MPKSRREGIVYSIDGNFESSRITSSFAWFTNEKGSDRRWLFLKQSYYSWSKLASYHFTTLQFRQKVKDVPRKQIYLTTFYVQAFFLHNYMITKKFVDPVFMNLDTNKEVVLQVIASPHVGVSFTD